MKTFISMILMLFALTAMAETTASAAESIVNKANAAYEKDDFNQAVQLYEQAAKQEGTSSMLYYNMGNAYYRLGNMGKAVLCYERSLLLDPSNDDARTTILWANAGLGVAITPAAAVNLAAHNHLHVKRIDEPSLETRLAAIWPRSRYLSAVAKHFLQSF